MLVTILPFFLAAYVAIDDNLSENNPWHEFGPEATYDVLVNMTLSNVIEKTDNYCSMIASELKCRPKGSDTLSCHFTNSKIKRPDAEDNRCTNSRNFVPVSTKFVNEDPFELRFNSRGIENLVVSRSIPRWRLDMIRVIIDQLNIGFDLEKSNRRLIVTENSNIGQCEVEVKLDRLGYENVELDFSDSENSAFHIDFEPERPGIMNLDEAVLQIDKIRHPKSCPNKRAYFFGNHEDYSFKNTSIYINMVTSSSHIMISKDNFESYSEVTGVMKSSEKSRTMNLFQKISLTLKEISHAESPMPDIRNPASTSPFAYSDFNRKRRSLMKF